MADHDKLIDKYLRGELSEVERAALKRLKTKPGFAAELTFAEDVQGVFKFAERERLKAGLRTLERRQPFVDPDAPAPKRRVPWSYLGAVAAIGLLLIAFALFWPEGSGANTGQLFAEHYGPYPNDLVATTRGNNTTPNDWRAAFEAYEAEDYATAVERFEALESADSLVSALRFYRANALLALGEAETAADLLEPLTLGDAPFSREAGWYLALAELQGEHVGAARRILTDIANDPGHPFKRQAEALLEEIKQ